MKAIKEILSTLLSKDSKLVEVLDEVISTKEERDEVYADLLRLQSQINLKEAEHGSIFVSGWRPFIGWECGSGLAYHFIIRDLMQWVLLNAGVEVTQLPLFDTSQLMTILMALLGLGGMRTWEAAKGVKRNKL